MSRKNYSEEFRRQAVDLYESTPGATVRGIAADLGIVRGTLRQWLDAYGTGKKTAVDGTLTSSPLRSNSPSAPEGETPEQKIARCRQRSNMRPIRRSKTRPPVRRVLVCRVLGSDAGQGVDPAVA